MLASGVAIVTSQSPIQRGVAGEAPAGGDADPRHHSGQRGKATERRDVEPADSPYVDVARPAAAALGEQHERQPLATHHLEESVCLLVTGRALRPGQDHHVVADDGNAATVDGPDAGDHPVCGSRAISSSKARRPAVLRREAAPLVEAAGVEQVVEVLADGAPAATVDLRDRLGARLVGQQPLALSDLGELRPYVPRRSRDEVSRHPGPPRPRDDQPSEPRYSG